MRIGLAGVGHWHAGMHAEAARANGAELAGAWDPDPAAARRFAAVTAVPAVDSLARLVAGSDLLVCMGTPATARAAALAGLDAGRPIVLEKPAAARADDLTAIAERADAGAFVAVPLPNRLGPIWDMAARLAADGRLGPLSHAGFRLINGPPERYRTDGVAWLLDPAIGGGGALRNLGIHGIDAARQLAALVGEDVRLVAARLGNIHGEVVEDYALLTFRLAGGATVTVETGYTFASLAPGGDFEWRISTGNAYLVDRGAAAEAMLLDAAGRVRLPPAPPATRYNLFMADTLVALAAGRAPSVGIADYVAAMRFIDAAYVLAEGEAA
jgi:predicted dehydrogenase